MLARGICAPVPHCAATLLASVDDGLIDERVDLLAVVPADRTRRRGEIDDRDIFLGDRPTVGAACAGARERARRSHQPRDARRRPDRESEAEAEMRTCRIGIADEVRNLRAELIGQQSRSRRCGRSRTVRKTSNDSRMHHDVRSIFGVVIANFLGAAGLPFRACRPVMAGRHSIAMISASACMISAVSPTLLPSSAVAIGAT